MLKQMLKLFARTFELAIGAHTHLRLNTLKPYVERSKHNHKQADGLIGR